MLILYGLYYFNFVAKSLQKGMVRVIDKQCINSVASFKIFNSTKELSSEHKNWKVFYE